jgi:hypothetical protein
VNSIDAFFTLSFAAGLSHVLPCGEAADVSGDGVINSVDALLIVQLDAGLISTLPAETARGALGEG